MGKKKKRIILAATISFVIVLAALTFFYFQFSLGPMFFSSAKDGQPGESYLKRWESLEAARQALGDKFLYPALPEWSKDDTINVNSQNLWNIFGNRKDYINIEVIIEPQANDALPLHIYYYAIDNNSRDSEKIEKRFNYLLFIENTDETLRWDEPERVDEIIEGIPVIFAYTPLWARARFGVDGIEYGIMIYHQNAWDKITDPSEFTDDEIQALQDIIWPCLREMTLSALSKN